MTSNGVAETHLLTVPRPGIRASSLMRAVNSLLRSLSVGVDEREPIAVFCECEIDGCFAICWMTRSALDVRLGDGEGWILSDGHRSREPSAEFARVDRKRPLPATTGSYLPTSRRASSEDATLLRCD